MAKSTDVVGWGDVPLTELSFDQLMEHGVIDISEIDDVVQVDQAELVGVPFILVEWDVKMSDRITRNGEPTAYAVVKVRTTEGLRIFADGGAGIVEQLERYKNKTINEPDALLYFHHGLTVSEYMYTDPATGDKAPARTYYFDNKPRP